MISRYGTYAPVAIVILLLVIVLYLNRILREIKAVKLEILKLQQPVESQHHAKNGMDL